MTYKRILLIVPPFYRLLGSKNDWINLGLHYIGANLSKHGYFVKIYNTDANPLIKERNYGIFFEKDIRQTLTNSPIWSEISSNIKRYNPDIVGITMSSVTEKMVYKIAKIVKQINSSIPVVVGGPHATLKPREILLNKDVDYVVQGEGEETFLDFLNRTNDPHRVRGIVWKPEWNPEGSSVEFTEKRNLIADLDLLPFPNFDLELVPVNPKKNFSVIQTSRGCAFNCTFCSSPKIWENKVRFRSINNVLEEIVYRKNTYGVSHLYFSDDTFNINTQRLRKLCKEIILKEPDITFSCEGRLNLIDRTTLKLMKKAGCTCIKVGLESGNNRILKLMKKQITVQESVSAIRKIQEVGIPVTVYAMIGMPTETKEEIMDTFNLCKKLNPDWVSLSIATPWYGTELYKMVKNSLKDSLLFHQSKSVINKNVTSDIITKFIELNNGKKRGTV